MVYEEYVRKAIASGRQYQELPERIRTVFSPGDWRNHVKEHCIQRGNDWGSSLARTVCSESEYYGELLKCYKGWMRMYPYHLAFYVNRVMRISPFRYYIDMLVAMLVAEKAYHQLPNFTAADALRLVGVGRNEYIAILNACKNRRVMWRVNRVSTARELLPQTPKEPLRLEPWWGVSCVNLGEPEYRELTPEEMAHVKTASLTSGSVQVRDLEESVLRELLRKGLLYIEVPVLTEDRFSIPPLEGFVSNKDAAPLGLEGGADPLESVLYAVFVANNERLTVSELAGILNVDTRLVQAALGVASRLGFATRVTPSLAPDTLASSPSLSGTRGGLGRASGGGALASSPVQSSFAPLIDLEEQDDEAGKGLSPAGRFGSQTLGSLAARESPFMDPFSSGEDERSAAVVLDSEATSFLMMGALSPGLKRHAVTLFEGGRVAGEGVMAEMVQELWSSFATGQIFEGDMLRLTQFAGALATAIEAVRGSLGPGRSLELLRKESLEGLPPTSASKVLATTYCVLLPVSPLPPPALPVAMEPPSSISQDTFSNPLHPTSLGQPAHPLPPIAYFGASTQASSPWLALTLYTLARSGPISLVLAAGQKVTRLPPQLECATHALLWPWDEGPGLARVKASGLFGDASVSSHVALVEAPLLLAAINEILAHTALMVQPINVASPLPPAPLASPAPPTLAPDASAPDPSLLPAAAAAAAAATSASGQGKGAGEAWGAFDDVDRSEGGLVASLAELTGWGSDGGWLGGFGGGGGSQHQQGEGVAHGDPHSSSVKRQGMMGTAAVGSQQQPSMSKGMEEGSLQGGIAHGTSSSGPCRKEGGGSAGPEGAVVDVPLPLPRALRDSVRASVPFLARYWDNGGVLHALHQPHQPQQQQQQQQQQVPPADNGSGVKDLLGDDVTLPVATKHTLPGGSQGSGSSPTTRGSGLSSRGRSSTERLPQALLLRGLDRRSGLPCDIAVARDLLVALEKTGLSGMVGYLRTARVPGMVSRTAATAVVTTAPPPAVPPKLTPCTPPPSSQPSAAQVPGLDRSQGGREDYHMWNWASTESSQGPVIAGINTGPPQDGLTKQASGAPSAVQHGQQEQAGGAVAGKEEVLQMGGGWVPVAVQLGVPLYSLSLCKAVCKCAREQGALSQEGREAQVLAQCMLQTALQDLISQFTVSTHSSSSAFASRGAAPAFAAVALPTCNMYFDGTNLEVVDLQGSLQRGGVSWCC